MKLICLVTICFHGIAGFPNVDTPGFMNYHENQFHSRKLPKAQSRKGGPIQEEILENFGNSIRDLCEDMECNVQPLYRKIIPKTVFYNIQLI